MCSFINDNIGKEKELNQEKQKKSREIEKSREIGGPKGLEPTRYGDWEKNGKTSDF